MVKQAIAAGHLSADGAFSQRCCAWLEEHFGCERALLTSSGSAALEVAAIVLDLGPGDEVIVPSYTFPTTASTFALAGAKIVFADIRSDTLNLDERSLADLVSDRTRAIVPVHYGGVVCDLDVVRAVAATVGASVVEDAAHWVPDERSPGMPRAVGHLQTLSFHETKSVHCGEGGAILVNDPDLVTAVETTRQKGTNRDAFMRGETDRYEWVAPGSSFVLADLLAAFLWAQLKEYHSIMARRRVLWRRYRSRLGDWAARSGVELPPDEESFPNSAHVFWLLMPDAGARQAAIDHLREHRVQAVFHFQPLHRSPMGRAIAPGTHCPVTDDVSSRILRLPLYTAMSEKASERVIEAVLAFTP